MTTDAIVREEVTQGLDEPAPRGDGAVRPEPELRTAWELIVPQSQVFLNEKEWVVGCGSRVDPHHISCEMLVCLVTMERVLECAVADDDSGAPGDFPIGTELGLIRPDELSQAKEGVETCEELRKEQDVVIGRGTR